MKPSSDSEKDVKISKKHKSIVITAVKIQEDFDLMLHKLDLHNVFWMSTWILRFINNRRIIKWEKNYIKHEQKKVASSDRFEDSKKRLNPEKNNEGVYIYKRKRQGLYRIYIPQDSV